MFKARIKVQDDDGNWLVPSEVLLHILSFLQNRWNFSMTCTQIYELTCSIERYCHPLKIKTEKLDDDAVFKSIIATQRQFSNIQIDTCRVNSLQHLWRLKAICFKFGLQIRDFTWESCKMTKQEIISVLNFMPNLTSLSVIAWKLQPELYDEPLPMLNLQKLVNLKISRCDKTTIEDFFTNHLPSNVITNLNLQNDPESFLMSQQSINKLELHADVFDDEHLRNMKLSELKLKLRRYRDGNQQSVIQRILSSQPDLISLDLIGCEGCFDGDDAAFIAVCNLEKLKILRLNIDELGPEVFAEFFNKQKGLEILELESLEHNFTPIVAVIDELSRMDMKHLENMKIYLNDVGVPVDRIVRMGDKLPKLKSFTIRCANPLPLDLYLCNLKNLESLVIDYHYIKEFSKFFSKYDFVAINLKFLTLQGFGFGSDDVNANEMTLWKLTDVVPNLHKLELDAVFPFSTEFIMKVLSKLKSLKVMKNWSMAQSGDNYNKFDFESVINLNEIATKMNQFTIELRLKAIDMDVSRVKDVLSKEFHFAMTRVGSFIVIRLEKK